jgi:hypothetical protein
MLFIDSAILTALSTIFPCDDIPRTFSSISPAILPSVLLPLPDGAGGFSTNAAGMDAAMILFAVDTPGEVNCTSMATEDRSMFMEPVDTAGALSDTPMDIPPMPVPPDAVNAGLFKDNNKPTLDRL